MNKIKIETEIIKLDAFMKYAAIVCSGSEAKFYIQDGTTVKVNLTSKPDWWTEDLDFLLVGKD